MLVDFPKFNIKLLVLLIFPVFRTIERYTTPLYITEDNSLFDTFRYFLCQIISVIFLYIFYKQNKGKKLISLAENIKGSFLLNVGTNEFQYTIGKNQNKRKKKSFFFLIYLSLNILFCFLYRTFFYGLVEDFEYEKQSMLIFFDIGFFILLSYLILKQKLYMHHYYSMLLMGLVLLVLFILTIKYIVIGKEFFYTAFYFCFYSFSFSLYDVLIKKYMNDYYKTPYFIMFMTGAINTVLLLIFDIFAYFFNRDISGVIIGFQKNINSIINVLFFIGTLIIEFFLVLGINLTIYYFTPCHFTILEYFSEYITYIQYVIESDEEFYSTTNVIIFTIAYIINFTCCLVFNEVIILNFCKLDYNTRQRIQERMANDNASEIDDEIQLNEIINENEDSKIIN